MPKVAYEVIVGVNAEVAKEESVAVAEANRYLAYGDTSDTFGYNGRVFDINVYDGPDGGWSDDEVLDWGVGIHFTAVVGLEKDKAAFERELEQLAKVESWQEIPTSSLTGS